MPLSIYNIHEKNFTNQNSEMHKNEIRYWWAKLTLSVDQRQPWWPPLYNPMSKIGKLKKYRKNNFWIKYYK